MYLTHITQEGERWDSLAHRYYGNALAYEQIIVANPQVSISPVLPSGLVLLIPVVAAVDEALEDLPPWLR